MTSNHALLMLVSAALFCPAMVLADVPGRPPAIEPDCPPGTTLEGPYGHWSCVPLAREAEDVPFADDAPTPVEPSTPEPAAIEPTEPELAEPELDVELAEVPVSPAAQHDASESAPGCGCRVAGGGSGENFGLVAGFLLLCGWRRRRG